MRDLCVFSSAIVYYPLGNCLYVGLGNLIFTIDRNAGLEIIYSPGDNLVIIF